MELGDKAFDQYAQALSLKGSNEQNKEGMRFEQLSHEIDSNAFGERLQII